MYKKGILLLSSLIVVSPFIVLPVFYDKIPEQVPVFMDLQGNPTLLMHKSLIAVLRIPFMGVMLQGICFTMVSIKPSSTLDKHERLWLTVSLLAAIKMSLTSVEVLLYQDPFLLNFIRNSVLAIILIAVVIIVFNLYHLYKIYRENFFLYLSVITNKQKTLLLAFLSGYLFFVFLPYL